MLFFLFKTYAAYYLCNCCSSQRRYVIINSKLLEIHKAFISCYLLFKETLLGQQCVVGYFATIMLVLIHRKYYRI